MTEPMRTESSQGPDDPGTPERDARIEQLLLNGLDHYFAGQYEQAINVWTRVAFLERGHARARAYIERARTAIAERHREAEELLHRGVEAFNRGETESARELINRAVEQVGPHDLALVFLDRLSRLGSVAFESPLPAGGMSTQRTVGERVRSPDPTASRPRRWALAISVGSAAVAAAVLIGVPLWVAEQEARPEPIQTTVEEPLPVAHSSEIVLARARALSAGGHLRDALRLLDRIDLADPFRGDADRLRADLQRRLLETVRAAVPLSGGESAEGRR